MSAEEMGLTDVRSILGVMTRDVCHALSLWLDNQHELGAMGLPVDSVVIQPRMEAAAHIRSTDDQRKSVSENGSVQRAESGKGDGKASNPLAEMAVSPTAKASKPLAEQAVSPAVSGSLQSFRAMRGLGGQLQYQTVEERRLGLETLNARLKACRQCMLGGIRRGVLCGYGPADAAMMFVAAGGNPREFDKGRLMTDDAAALLDKIVNAMATLDPRASADRIYMTNVIKCAAVPPREKGMDVARCCLGTLRQEVRIVSPKVIVIWGELALKAMFGEDRVISQARGCWQIFEGIPAIATHHPLEMLKNPKLKTRVWKDLQAAVQRMQEIP